MPKTLENILVTDEEYCAKFEEGRQARDFNRRFLRREEEGFYKTNPYKEGSFHYLAWDEGYHDKVVEFKKAEEK
jgi:hypothetical protein